MPPKYCVCKLNSNFTIQPLTQTLAQLLVEYQKGVVLKAVKNGEIIGSARAYTDGDTVFIGRLILCGVFVLLALPRNCLF
ncbi:MAG: hypothetical protein FWH04_01125 [Oscillospiraceae bacterium]|nr:hypothetical protein [Oscillospiraceae bacterium]